MPNVPWTSPGVPSAAMVDSISPTVRSSAAIGSSSSPNVSARWNTTSVSVEPRMVGKSSGKGLSTTLTVMPVSSCHFGPEKTFGPSAIRPASDR